MKKNKGDVVTFLKQQNYIMINENLGSGSFGQTVILSDPFLDILLVGKKYQPQEESIKKDFYKNFLDEIKILFKLNHKNIVRIYNYYPYEELTTAYILMEYIDGVTIDKYFDENVFDDSNLLDDIFIQLIDAFEYLERNNIVHRDIRASNILIAEDPSPVVKLIDFGLGKIHEKVSIPKHDSLANVINREHACTMPNEYYTEEYSIQTDMYYLGDLYSTLLENINISYNFSYKNILMKMRNKNRLNRYESFTEIKESLNDRQILRLQFSDNEKAIYRKFTDAITTIIVGTVNKQEFERNISVFLSNMENILSLNRFEMFVISPKVGNLFIKGKYKMQTSYKMPVKFIEDFYYWFNGLERASQEIVFKNMLNKFSSIPLLYEESVPF